MPTREQLAQQHYRPVPPRRSAPAHHHTDTMPVAPLHARKPPLQQPQVADDLEEDARYYPVRSSSTAIRYTTTQDQEVIQQGNQRIILHHEPPPTRQQQGQTAPAVQPRPHWVLFVGIAMLLMLVGWVLVSLLLQWWSTSQDDLHYGRPRTFQIDQKVGHGDSTIPSHFIAMNLNHQVQVIECPAGDCSKAVIYVGAQIIGDGSELTVVTLTFKDVNGDGKIDMLVHVADQTYVFVNDHDKFRPARADEHLSV